MLPLPHEVSNQALQTRSPARLEEGLRSARYNGCKVLTTHVAPYVCRQLSSGRRESVLPIEDPRPQQRQDNRALLAELAGRRFAGRPQSIVAAGEGLIAP